MIEFFVKRPVTTVVLVLFFVILGAVSYGDLNVELTPKINFPIVTITVEYPGATPSRSRRRSSTTSKRRWRSCPR